MKTKEELKEDARWQLKQAGRFFREFEKEWALIAASAAIAEIQDRMNRPIEFQLLLQPAKQEMLQAVAEIINEASLQLQEKILAQYNAGSQRDDRREKKNEQ